MSMLIFQFKNDFYFFEIFISKITNNDLSQTYKTYDE